LALIPLAPLRMCMQTTITFEYLLFFFWKGQNDEEGLLNQSPKP
jgi:hypothetical protein